MFNDNKNNPLNGQTPFSTGTLNLNGKSYTLRETKNANGDVVYRSIVDDKLFGIF